MQTIQDPALEQLLVADSDLDRVTLRAVFFEPGGDERHVTCAACSSSPLIIRSGGPIEVDTICCVLSIQWLICEQRLYTFR